MIDIHCHILPAVDDGSTSWEMTLEMCRLAQKDGIGQIVATPHANHRYGFDRDRNQDMLEELKIQILHSCNFPSAAIFMSPRKCSRCYCAPSTPLVIAKITIAQSRCLSGRI